MKYIFLMFLIACGTSQPGPIGPSGPSGKDGSTGATGADGKDGSNATATKFVGSIFCQGLLPAQGSYSGGLSAKYSVDVDSAGDIFATGYVTGNEVQYGANANYAATQNGASDAAVIFTYDISAPADGGWWQLTLNRSTLVTSVVYNDFDVGGNGKLAWTMQSSQCIVNSY